MPNILKPSKFDYSEINEYLLMGVTPKKQDYKYLKSIGVNLVINMRLERPSSQKVIKSIWLPTLDSKLLPIKPKLLSEGVMKAQHPINNKGKVYVYCRAGRHRSLVMSAAILISQGSSAEEAIETIKLKRPNADADAKHIKKAVYRFEEWWRSNI